KIFADLPVSRGGEFLRMAVERTYQPGQLLIQAGTMGDEFFVILSGVAGVVVDGKEIKAYAAYDYIGETSLILAQPRTADVVAKTVVEAAVLSRSHFLHLIRGTDLPERLARLA